MVSVWCLDICLPLFCPAFGHYLAVSLLCRPMSTSGSMKFNTRFFTSHVNALLSSLDGKNYSSCASQVELWLIVNETRLTKKKDNFSIVDHPVWKKVELSCVVPSKPPFIHVFTMYFTLTNLQSNTNTCQTTFYKNFSRTIRFVKFSRPSIGLPD